MAEDETPGFTVVDKRHSTQAAQAQPATDASASPSTSSDIHETDSSAQTRSASEKAPPSGASSPPPPTGEAAPEQAPSGESFLPDPATLVVLGAMQMDIRSLVETLLAVFDGHAWRALGLLANPQTGEVQTDLPSAQLAIDCVQFLLSKIENSLPYAERREAQRRLTDLRMNYLAKRNEPR